MSHELIINLLCLSVFILAGFQVLQLMHLLLKRVTATNKWYWNVLYLMVWLVLCVYLMVMGSSVVDVFLGK